MISFVPSLTANQGVSLIVPVFNEQRTVEAIIYRCLEQPVITQIVVVNDGSMDNTPAILETVRERMSISGRITIMHHDKNLGKGAAIKTGLTNVLGKYVMIQDGDLEYAPEDINNLFVHAETTGGIVFGSRTANRRKGYLLAQLGNWYLTLLFNRLFGLKLTDPYTCYKLIPRTIWQDLRLTSNGFEIDSELVAKLGVMGCNIREIPISYQPRPYSEGKKIQWVDLVKATDVAVRIRLSKL